MTSIRVRTAIPLILALLLLALPGPALAHFGVILPSDDIVEAGEGRGISLEVSFKHPFEGHFMQMDRPKAFGFLWRGGKTDLLGSLKGVPKKGGTAWRAECKIAGPGDHVFYVEPAPYWEPAEERFIVHYTKVVVNSMGLEEGWDREVGLPTEIVPLSRPYGLWAGNVFQGVVKVGGKPVPFAEVEIEYLNMDGQVRAPATPFITQRIKADQNGVFTYGMPREGWWGFSALSEAGYKLPREGRDYPVELGAVLWVRTRGMK